jgi:hypothetical protein
MITAIMKKICTLVFISFLFQVSYGQYTDYYWVGGSGDVSDYANHWATSSGGSTFHTEEPDSDSNLIFDSNSFSSSGQTVSLTAGLICHDFLAKNTTNSPTFEANSNDISIYGSYSLNPSASYNFNAVYFQSSNSETIDLDGLTINSFYERWEFNNGGTYEFISDATFDANFIDVTGGFIQINSGVTFTTTRLIRLNAGATLLNFGTLIFDSGSYLNIVSGGVSGNDIIFKRNTTFGESEGKYSIVGSPVTSASTSTLGNIVYKYDESQDYIGNDGLDRFVQVTSPETMTPGKGYFSANTGTITVSGMPNLGNIDVSLEYSSSASTEADYDGFNLVSNPYPTTLKVSNFLNANGTSGTGAISDEIYLWVDGGSNNGRRSNTDYLTVNGVGYVGGSLSRAGDYNNNLGSFQGFFVKATGTGQTLSFTESMRNVESGDDDNFFRESQEEIFKIRVAVENEKLHAETLIGFLEDATMGFDPVYDAKSMLASNALNITTLISNTAYSIQGRPLTSETDYIPLNFVTETEGAHQLIFDFEHLPFDQKVSLYDTYNSKVYDLNVNDTYDFTSDVGNFQDRFQLITGNKIIMAVEENLSSTVKYTFSKNNVNVKSAQPIQSAVIYSLQGKVLDKMLFESHEKVRSFRMKNYQEKLIIIMTTDIYGKSDVQKFLIK